MADAKKKDKKKGTKTPKKQATSVQGEIYVGIGGDYYTKPTINAETIKKTLLNNYVSEQIDRLKSLMFCDRFSITVFDENGEEDEDLSFELFKMMDSANVDLWSRMQQGWVDAFCWGAGFFNPVWQIDGSELKLDALRRLDPYTFGKQGSGYFETYTRILLGVTKDKNGNIEYTQTQTHQKRVKLKNIDMIKDPTDTELAGDSKLVPIIPVISMLNFAWQSQIQKVNRIGAPIMFIKITDPIVNETRDDPKYAQTLLQNWGKGTAHLLKENMEVIKLDFQDTSSADKTIEMLEKRVLDYFSPSTLIKKVGETLGGNASAEVDLIKEWLKGQHRWIERFFERYPQHYLDVNGYSGYTCKIDIPEPRPDREDLNIQKAEKLWNTRSGTVNEIRSMMGLPPLEQKDIDELQDWYKDILQPQMGGLLGGNPAGFQFMPVAVQNKEADSHRDLSSGEEKTLSQKLETNMEDLKKKFQNILIKPEES